MKTRSLLFAAAVALLFAIAPQQSSAQKKSTLHIITTGDVHGSFFDQPYVSGEKTKTSMMSAKVVIDSLRQVAGKDNFLVLDAGDVLQGDMSVYYYNYVADSTETHIFPRIAEYVGYDAVVPGNHDIETGHPVYDRITEDLKERNIPWLAGNVLKVSDGSTYFPLYRTFKKAGVKVAVFGFENANIPAWLGKEQYEGMDFLSLVPYAQSLIDYVVKKENPQVVIVVAHTGTGTGDGSQLESQGMDLFNSLKGVDLLVGAHDHRPFVTSRQGMGYINAGNNVRNVGHAVIDLTFSGKKLIAKDVEVELCAVNKEKVDWVMESAFKDDFEKIKAYTNRPIGVLATTLDADGCDDGMCEYLNMLHTVQLKASGADVSFAAPLSSKFSIKPKTIIYHEMMTLYRFENKMNVVAMKGSEIKDYLEYSYEMWLNGNVPTYNHDSAGGIIYTVDAAKPNGERVEIKSFADGRPFEMNDVYRVAMTSYRANGGGDIMPKGAGLDKDAVIDRTSATYDSIRDLVQNFFESMDEVDHAAVADPSVIGHWSFLNR